MIVRLFRDCLSSYSSWVIDDIEYREVPCNCHPETCCHIDGKIVINKNLNSEQGVKECDTTMSNQG